MDADGGPGTDTATYIGTGDGDQITSVRDAGDVVRTFAPGAPLIGVTAVEELVAKGGEANDALSAVGNVAALTHLTAGRRQRRGRRCVAATATTCCWVATATI